MLCCAGCADTNFIVHMFVSSTFDVDTPGQNLWDSHLLERPLQVERDKKILPIRPLILSVR